MVGDEGYADESFDFIVQFEVFDFPNGNCVRTFMREVHEVDFEKYVESVLTHRINVATYCAMNIPEVTFVRETLIRLPQEE